MKVHKMYKINKRHHIRFFFILFNILCFNSLFSQYLFKALLFCFKFFFGNNRLKNLLNTDQAQKFRSYLISSVLYIHFLAYDNKN